MIRVILDKANVFRNSIETSKNEEKLESQRKIQNSSEIEVNTVDSFPTFKEKQHQVN